MTTSRTDTIAALKARIDGIMTVASREEGDFGDGRNGDGGRRAAESARALQGPHEGRGTSSRDTAKGAALSKIVAIVNASDKSEKAIRDRLAREGFGCGEIDEAVEQAKLYGFIDDGRFAEVLVRSRISQMRGSAGIVRELAENGIDPYSVPGWPQEFPLSHEDELNRALDLLKRKPPRSKNAREGAYRRLAQKGYPSSVCSSAARIWSESALERQDA